MFNQRPAFPRPVPAEITCAVMRIMGTEEISFQNRVQDPFMVESECTSAGGHVFISDRDSIVCEHCSRLVWP